MKIYLDIDGVLLTKNQKLPEYSSEFIDFIVKRYDCYWLTTHCRGGENKAIQYLKLFYEEKDIQQLEKLKPTNWTTLKTEAIDFEANFIWLEDYPFEAEKQILAQNNKEKYLIEVNLNRKGELQEVIQQILFLEKRLTN